MDASKQQPMTTAGLDLGDKYSYLCLIDTESGEIIEEGRLRTIPEAFRRRFASERTLRIAIEAGTHSPWVSRVLQGCGHEVLVANARKLRLIYSDGSHNAPSHQSAGSPRVRMEAWREGHGVVALDRKGAATSALDRMCLLMEVRLQPPA